MARILRIALPPGPAGYDAEQGGVNSLFHRLQFRRLLTYPPKAGTELADVPNPVGWLAKSWDVSPDHLEVRVHLRDDVVSAAGNPFTADDVVWSWQRAFGVRDVGKWVALIGSIRSEHNVIAEDAHTVLFKLSAPNPTLIQQLTRQTPAIHDSVLARQHATESDPWAKEWLRGNPAGFGTYKLDEYLPWKSARFSAVNKAHFDTIEVTILAGHNARADLLLAGEVDLLPNIEPADLARLQGVAGIRVSHQPSGAHVGILMNPAYPPFDNPLVRKAVASAIPTDRINQEVYAGTAAIWRSALPETVYGAAPEYPGPSYDPARAKALLAESGMADGFEADLFVDAADTEHVDAAKIAVEALGEVGIRIRLELLDPSNLWMGGRHIRKFPMHIWQDHHQVPDPYYGLVHDYKSGRMGLINCGNYVNPQVDALIAQIEATPDLDARDKLVRETQRIIIEDCPNAMLVQPAFLAAMRDDLEGWYWLPDRAFPATLKRTETA